MCKTCANTCGPIIDISENLSPLISSFSASWSMGRSGKTLLLSHVAPHWGNESEIWMPTSKRGDGVSDFHKIHRKYRSTWKEPIPTFLLWIVELPMMKCDEKHQEKIQDITMQKSFGKNAGCCIHVLESPSMPSAGMCVCVQMRQLIEWATFQMPRKQTLKPNNQPTSNRNDSTSHQSKARFWTFTSSPPLAMGAKTNGASRFTAAFLSWSWLLTSYANYGSRMPNVATLPSDLMEIVIFLAPASLWSTDCTYVIPDSESLLHPTRRHWPIPCPYEKWHATTKTNCLLAWHHLVGYVFSLGCILAYDPHFYTALSKSTGNKKCRCVHCGPTNLPLVNVKKHHAKNPNNPLWLPCANNFPQDIKPGDPWRFPRRFRVSTCGVPSELQL